MPAWVLWAIVTVLLAVGEIFTPGLFFLGPIALENPFVYRVLSYGYATLVYDAVLRPLYARGVRDITPAIVGLTAALSRLSASLRPQSGLAALTAASAEPQGRNYVMSSGLPARPTPHDL